MATTSNESDSSRNNTDNKENDSKDEQNNMFECCICWDTAKYPVVSLCGHLFCWPCLRQWLEMRPFRQICPVCKAVISKDKVIPIYGRRGTNPEDPRIRLPLRPPNHAVMGVFERIISNYIIL